MYTAQAALSDIPTADFLLVEEYSPRAEEVEILRRHAQGQGYQTSSRPRGYSGARHYFFHSLVGRAANEALSRVVALRLGRLKAGKNAVATADDYGFVLSVAADQLVDASDLPGLLTTERFADDLHDSLSRSELLKYHFRNAAQTGMMVYRNYFGDQKSLRKVQWSSEIIFNVLLQYEPDHVLLREARRDAVHTYIDLERAEDYLRYIEKREMRLQRVHCATFVVRDVCHQNQRSIAG